ncbi:MAG: small multi-drug export protein [Lachnospiraceae bacterium]|nr:small multi-drug export protein [Lachnospiraceae bacterium]
MESLVLWYQSSLGHFLPKELFVFFVSMLPLIELRGGVVVATLLKIPLIKANIICIIGNIIPIPFILLFIKKIFEFMKKHNILSGLVYKLEARAEKKSSGVEKGEFIFLLLFVGVPLPGTGAWTGSLIASLLEFDIKKASLAILLGVLMATVIMDIVSYGVLGTMIG